jgi:hypothetical protein
MMAYRFFFFTIRNFMIYISHMVATLLKCRNLWWTGYVDLMRRQVHTEFWWENPLENGHYEEWEEDTKITMKWVLRVCCVDGRWKNWLRTFPILGFGIRNVKTWGCTITATTVTSIIHYCGWVESWNMENLFKCWPLGTEYRHSQVR